MIRSRAAINNNNNSNHSSSSSSPKRGEASNVKRAHAGNKKDDRRGNVTPLGPIIALMVLATVVMYLTGLYGLLYIGNVSPKPRPLPTSSSSSSSSKSSASSSSKANKAARKILDDVRRQFNERYKVDGTNGKNIFNGPELLQKGLHSFGSIDHTALRILDASNAKRPFVMAFSGYSITVGRGNFFNQSFPFVAEGVLKEPMQKLFDIPLVVRNSAIGGIPSFPYGFCMEHFLGSDPDVISWDYSMNEGGGDASVLEAFLRQATQQLSKRPMVIMIDTNANRMRTLDEYTKKRWLKDAIAIGKKEILNEEEIFGETGGGQQLPVGFQEWNEFGAVSYTVDWIRLD